MDYCDMSTSELFELGLKEKEEKVAQADFERRVRHKMEQDEANRQAMQESDALLKRRFETMSEKQRIDELEKMSEGSADV